MAPRTPAIIGMTSLLPEGRAITGEPKKEKESAKKKQEPITID